MTRSASVASEEQIQSRPIVVGVDGSKPSRLALGRAVREAEAHSNKVLAISAYGFPGVAAAGPGFSFAPAEMQALADNCRDVLAAEIAEASEGHPSVRIEGKVFQGPAAQVLIDASKRAEVLVVGSRGHGGFVGLLLGSVSQQCVIHAHCPVLVVRALQEPDTVAGAQAGKPDSTTRD
jgi:nucleotide-binding universal stress UspA family protein